VVSPIDRAALIEQAALVAYDSHFPNSTPDRSDLGIEGHGILATLPVIAKALFAPLRELHPMGFNLPWGIPICTACDCVKPCPTERLLDAIERDL